MTPLPFHLRPLSRLFSVEGKNQNTSHTSSARTGMADNSWLFYQWLSVAGSYPRGIMGMTGKPPKGSVLRISVIDLVMSAVGWI